MIASTSVDDNKWIVLLYADPNVVDQREFRLVYAVEGQKDSKYPVSAVEGNALGSEKGSFVVRGNSNSEFGGWQAVSVPEPTSGLLFLLGVAGLALKRKRA